VLPARVEVLRERQTSRMLRPAADVRSGDVRLPERQEEVRPAVLRQERHMLRREVLWRQGDLLRREVLRGEADVLQRRLLRQGNREVLPGALLQEGSDVLSLPLLRPGRDVLRQRLLRQGRDLHDDAIARRQLLDPLGCGDPSSLLPQAARAHVGLLLPARHRRRKDPPHEDLLPAEQSPLLRRARLPLR